MDPWTPGRARRDLTISTAMARSSCSASAAFFSRFQDLLDECDTRDACKPFGLIGGAKDKDTRDDRRLAVTTDAPELGEPLTEGARSKTGCVCMKSAPELILFDGLLEIGRHRFGERRCGGTDEGLGRRFDLVTRKEFALVAHGDGHLDETDTVEIFHMYGVGMIPVLRVVSAHEQEVVEVRVRPLREDRPATRCDSGHAR